MDFLKYFNTSYWLIPSYAPSYGQLGNYDVWGQSILMYFFLICTAVTLAIVTLADSGSSLGSASSAIMNTVSSTVAPSSELSPSNNYPPNVNNIIGGKKIKRKTKRR